MNKPLFMSIIVSQDKIRRKGTLQDIPQEKQKKKSGRLYLRKYTPLCFGAVGMEEANAYNDLYDDFCMPVQKPIVKEKKVYPNDPCPCGSDKPSNP